MPLSLTSYINSLDYRYDECERMLSNISIFFTGLANAFNVKSWHTCYIYANFLSAEFLDLKNEFGNIGLSVRYWTKQSLIYINDKAISEAPEITWQAICEAWGKDDFEGRVWTIAFIDRMRQILWDEPFNVLWAARPEEQEL